MTPKEEEKLYQTIENDEWISASRVNDLARELVSSAENSFKKDHRMNIRINRRDMELLKTRAMEEGIPYQTLVSSILHKYVTGKLGEN